MAAEARRFASPGTSITAVTAAFGTQYVENRAEAAIAGHAVLDALAKHAASADAAIVCAFGDPGLAAAREFADISIVGIEESAILTAWMLGRRYSIICLTPRLRTWAYRVRPGARSCRPPGERTRADCADRGHHACQGAVPRGAAAHVSRRDRTGRGGGHHLWWWSHRRAGTRAARRGAGANPGWRKLRCTDGGGVGRPASTCATTRQLRTAGYEASKGPRSRTDETHHRRAAIASRDG